MKVNSILLGDLSENTYVEIVQNTIYNIGYICPKCAYLKRKLTFVHKNPNIFSRINFKVILKEKAKLDLEILLRIDKGAVNTDTFLNVRAMLLRDDTYIRIIPSLEIHESEVKAGHGATISYIDELQSYYLKTRGLNMKQVENLLVSAFLQFEE
ncbi:MAG: SufD family Fe-S cluster assembly protein [Candidatus Dojkabacteria bacterium]|nr:SufD family Fe-S cluster assembly protein [Candidatus Dojkabacteria bacterium]